MVFKSILRRDSRRKLLHQMKKANIIRAKKSQSRRPGERKVIQTQMVKQRNQARGRKRLESYHTFK